MGALHTSARVLVVDDEPSVCQLMNDVLFRAGFDCQSCATGDEALNLLRQEPFDIVITDLYMPGISGMSLLEQGRRVRPDSAFLMATGESDARVGVEAMKQGATDYLVKPFQMNSLLASLRRAQENRATAVEADPDEGHLRLLAAKRTAQLRRALKRIDYLYHETVETLNAVLDVRDNETAGHAQRVCHYTLEIGRRMGFPENVLRDFARGALLHDIGKVGIPDDILLKPAKLTPEEASVMRTHVTIGYNLLRHLDYLSAAAKIVLSHHEHFDGSGYPRGLKGEEIPIGARVFAVADALDAMTTDRPYRSALLLESARAEIIAQSRLQFDPEVVSAFLSIPEMTLTAIRERLHAVYRKTNRLPPQFAGVAHESAE